MAVLAPFRTVPACWASNIRVQLTADQILDREYRCPWCGRVIGVRPGKDGKATVPRHRRSEK
jgi:hypothetical protein